MMVSKKWKIKVSKKNRDSRSPPYWPPAYDWVAIERNHGWDIMQYSNTQKYTLKKHVYTLSKNTLKLHFPKTLQNYTFQKHFQKYPFKKCLLKIHFQNPLTIASFTENVSCKDCGNWVIWTNLTVSNFAENVLLEGEHWM